VISNAGTVGIGQFPRTNLANTPSGTLHLWGLGTTGSNAIINFGDITNASNAYIKEATNGDSDQLELGGRQGLIFATGTNTTYGFERMRIDSSGNVAINNTGTVQATFDVRGISGTNPVASVSGATSRAALLVDNSGVGDLFTASKSGATKFVIKNNGYVGVNNTNPNYLFTVQPMFNGQDAFAINSFGSNTPAATFRSFSNGGQFVMYDSGNETLMLNGASQSYFSNPLTVGLFPGDTVLAGLDVRGPDGINGLDFNQPVASISGRTGKATLVVDQSSTGDLFAASKSGATKFVIQNNGTLVAGPDAAAAISNNLILPNTLAHFAGNTNSYTQVNVQNRNNGGSASSDYIATADNGNDTSNYIDLGINSSTYNDANYTIGAINDGYLYNNGGDLSLGTQTAGMMLKFHTGGTLAANERMRIDGNGNVSINNTSALSTLDVRANTYTTPVASFSGQTGKATLMVDQSGVGDLLTASSSGLTRFRIANNGSVLFQGDTLSSVGSLGNNSLAASETNQSSVINAIGDQGSLVPNSGFESILTANKTTNNAAGPVADGWVATATMSAAVTRIATDSAKGTAAVMFKLNASQSTSVSSVCLPLTLRITGVYNLNFYANTVTSTSPAVRGFLDSYTTKENCQSDTSRTSFVQGNATASTTNSWKVYGGATAVTTSGTNKWARVRIAVTCPASCATGNIIYIDGVRLIETSNAVGVDYAEQYPIDPAIRPEEGDVVSLVASNGASLVRQTSQYMDPSAIGVVSTNPGQVLDDGSMGDAKVPVALAGRIPTKVSTKNGAIHAGDYLTSSDMPGVAVKALSAGPVIGQAMEEYNESDASQIGKVVMFVKNTYYNGIPLTLNSGLTQDHAQGDLEFLGTLVDAAQKTASSSSALTKVSADRLVAGLDVIAPKVTTDTLQVNTIKAAGESDISVRLSDAGEFVIRNASGEARVAFDGAGNAYFTGTITADKIKANQIEGLDISTASTNSLESRVSALETLLASSSAIQLPTASPTASPIEDQVFLASLESVQDATVSGALRVQGNGLVEGVLHVVDTLTAGNLIVNQVADFFSNVVFHGDVIFAGRPTFNADTAGYVTIPKGSDNTTVNFKDEYKSQPVINASIVTQQVTDDFYKKLQSDGVCTSDQSKADCEDSYTKSILSEGAQFVIAKRSTKGFIIVLSNKTSQDMTFSWSAFSVGTQTSMKGPATQ
jgi:hypothetical protein